jgi:uncharacterized membrane protein (UPF0127 family)
MARPHFLAPLLKASADGFALVAAGRDAPIATRLSPAFDSAARRRGLLGRTSLADDEALILAPCNAVHTFGMTFTIDVVYVARDGRVVKVRGRLAPRRVSAALSAFAVIELGEGSVARYGLQNGDRLEIRSLDTLPTV